MRGRTLEQRKRAFSQKMIEGGLSLSDIIDYADDKGRTRVNLALAEQNTQNVRDFAAGSMDVGEPYKVYWDGRETMVKVLNNEQNRNGFIQIEVQGRKKWVSPVGLA